MVKHAFVCVRLSVIALLVNLIFDMAILFYKKSNRRFLHFVIFALAIALLMTGKVSAVLIVLLASLSGFIPRFKRSKQ